ncbi:GNAT family N-acetyltransferase [Nocardioides bizhenqiangii]|uniref:GNAT family N-acetyltransferase n=1 Tax=Nocardioides bizhenqiangii TaxID=3095076 RepID=A0ABZ0ZUE1_9ACTN|nr:MULTISPECIES: GNAT family N-acetyltransferase [unclassified Nocardioides]MDZ5622973.1 GNAT family N-acetyltransferase [Nocardioides sp. HM23]WQQ27956.1 GNAT family N-acetyltransferase [Nocardioides sp. HM61]
MQNLETERLILRPWQHDDAPRLLDILSRIEVMKWLGDGPPKLMKDLEEAHERIDKYAERSVEPPRGIWAIEPKAGGEPRGTALLVTLPDAEDGEVEIGWHLHPDSWGHGYATEAASAVLAHGFAAGLPEILAVTHLGNRPSQRVCRRIGMRPQGVVEKWYDGPSELFRITAEEWAAGQHP